MPERGAHQGPARRGVPRAHRHPTFPQALCPVQVMAAHQLSGLRFAAHPLGDPTGKVTPTFETMHNWCV